MNDENGGGDNGQLTEFTTTDSLKEYLLEKSDEHLGKHVATLAKLAKPSDYKPPKPEPCEFDGLNFIVHRLPKPNSKRH